MDRRAAAAVLILGLASAPGPALAANGSIGQFTKTSTGNITFSVQDVASPALVGTPAYGFNLLIQTGSTQGSITITAPAIVGTAGNTILRSAFSASCTATSDPNGTFTSLGIVRLGVTAVTCAQIDPGQSTQIRFDVTLYIDKMANAAGAFSADTYASGSLTVTANAP